MRKMSFYSHKQLVQVKYPLELFNHVQHPLRNLYNPHTTTPSLTGFSLSWIDCINFLKKLTNQFQVSHLTFQSRI